MKRWIHASKDYKKVNASTSFDTWYDSLGSSDQAKVDKLADDMGLPLYEECSEAELARLHDSFVPNKGSSSISASDSTDSQPTFQEWLEREYYEGFDPSGLSDEEYYELEDAYYESIGPPSSGMTKKQFDKWWYTLSRSEMDKVADIMEDMGLLTIKSENWTDSERKEIKDIFESKYR